MASPSVIVKAPPVLIFYPDIASKTPHCVDETRKALINYGVDPKRIERISDGCTLRNRLAQVKNGTLVIPGRSTYSISMELSRVVKDVQDAVAKGWGYLGICAGGNLAAWEFGINRESPEWPLLQLLPIRADFPAYPIDMEDEKDIQRIALIESKIGSFQCFWKEGSSFSSLEEAETFQRVAKYTDLKGALAVVSGDHVNGKVVVTGIHPEIDPPTDTEDLTAPVRKKFLHSLFQTVGIFPG